MTLKHFASCMAVLAIAMVGGASNFQCQDNPIDCPTGFRLHSSPSYIIAGPTRVRAGESVNVHAVILKLNYPKLTIRASVLRFKEELCFVHETFTSASRRLLKMKLPLQSEPGNYSLKIEGLSTEGSSGLLFQNVTKLEFQSKRVSVFMFTDQQIYQKRGTIKIRVVVLKPDLMPVNKGTMNVYVKDAKGQAIRRQLAASLNNGMYSFDCPTAHPAKHGWWTIKVEGWGHTYTSHFKTESYYYHLHEVNLTTPVFVKESDFGIGGVISAHHPTLMPSNGNASVKLEIVPPGKKTGTIIKRYFSDFHGSEGFTVPMSEIAKHTHKLAGTKVKSVAEVTTWYDIETNKGKSVTRIIGDSYEIKFIGGYVRVFKPNAPFHLYIVVYSENGRKFERENNIMVLVQISVISVTGQMKNLEEKSYHIPRSSIIKVLYTPDFDDQTIEISAKYDAPGNQYRKMKATRHFTASKKYLSISTSTETPTVGSYAVFTIRTSTRIKDVFYEILSNGRIVATDQILMESEQKTFSIAMSRELAPNARIVVFGLINTGEILTDSMSFYVKGIRKNKLKININKGKDFTGDTIEVNAIGDPSTMTVFKTEDYDFYKRKSKKLDLFFNEHMLEEDLQSYDDHVFSRFKHTWLKDEMRKENIYFTSPSYGIDANTTFEYAGLTVITDANVPIIETALTECNVTRGKLPCFTSGCYLAEQKCDGIYDCEDWADEIECERSDNVEELDVIEDYYRIWIHLDKKAWGWKTYYTKPFGRVDFKLKPPLRATTWVIGGFSLSPINGLAFTEEPTRLNTARTFFIALMTPKSAVRGEQIGIQVAAFNYWNHPVEALLILKASKYYAFVLVDTKRVQSAYSPKTMKGKDVQTMITLQPGESKMIKFPILPLINSGKIKVTIVGESNINRMTTTKTIKLRYDGIVNTFHTPFVIDMTKSGSLYVNDINIPVNARFKNHPEQRIHNYVIGSPKATLTVCGDILGIGFSKTSHVTLWNSAGYAFGSGENSVFHFAYNYYILKYLRDTNQLNSKVNKDAIVGLNKDLIEIYAFIAKDGGFAMRGKKSATSVWMTGLTLETLAAGSRAEWESSIYIDPKVLSKMSNWLCDQQNTSTGGFHRQSHFFDLNLVSATKNIHGDLYYAAENAYAVIGLAEATKVLKGDALTRASKAKSMATEYLAESFHLLTDPYEISIVTYALTITKHQIKMQALAKLIELRRDEGELSYWSGTVIEKNMITTQNTIKYIQPRLYPTEFETRAVQTTAFAMLVYIQNNMFKESKSVMMWLQSMRNKDNIFEATQDTLRATQALVAYTERDTDRSNYDMEIKVTSVADNDWKKVIRFKKENIGKTYELKLPKVFNTIKTQGKGIGMVLMQLSTTVNVEHKELLRSPAVRSFDLWVENKNFYGRNSSLMEMTVCARWLRMDLAPHSGAAIIEVDMPSGWYVRKETLKKFQRQPGDIPAMRSHLTKAKVVWYMEYIDDGDNNCFYFKGERWYPMANVSIQHEMRVYDNFEPSHINTTFYETDSLFHNHICLVCGSFQCPYCPGYNSVPRSVHPSLMLVALCIVFATLLNLKTQVAKLFTIS